MLTRTMIYTCFLNEQNIENLIKTILLKYRSKYCLQEIYETTLKVYFHDRHSCSATFADFVRVFRQIVGSDLYILTESAIVYNIPRRKHVRNRRDRLDIVLSRVRSFYGSVVDRLMLYRCCKTKLYSSLFLNDVYNVDFSLFYNKYFQ